MNWPAHDRRETLGLGARLTLAAVAVAVVGTLIALRYHEIDQADAAQPAGFVDGGGPTR